MRGYCTKFAAISLGLFVASGPLTAAYSAELKVWTARSIANVLREIGPQFENTSGRSLNVTVGVPAQFTKRIEAGESFDVLVLSSGYVDGLIKDGRIIADTRTSLARSGIGVEVRAGTPKPDISSVDAFKRALLDAKSIAYLKEGSGVYLDHLMQRLGIADAIKSKVTRPDTDVVSELVAKGEVEIGMVVVTQIVTTSGVDFVGPLPPEVQSYLVFTAAVSVNSDAPDAARDLIKFLTSPTAIPVIKSQGMEPG